MIITSESSWEQFRKFYFDFPGLGLRIDLSRMWIEDGFFERMGPRITQAWGAMNALEAGTIANSDEGRMVGHYWLRHPQLAPSEKITSEIETALASLDAFVEAVHGGRIQGQSGPFKNLLLIGIGGSSLGPQFVAHALGDPTKDLVKPYFFDNTDADGMRKILETIGNQLGQTLCIVVSKSGSTTETHNGMIEAARAYCAAGLQFERHSIAITLEGSKLHEIATQQRWLGCFPMWDWVGGRTSVFSVVGLLPAKLQGFNIKELVAGARACDQATRTPLVEKNPAMLLALAWFHSGGGIGQKSMIVIPYRDRLELFSRYLQQLVMESLGKAVRLKNRVIHQGLSVYGNKGSTDQHSYLQQILDGPRTSFVVFIESLSGTPHTKSTAYIEYPFRTDDYLAAFLEGTRQALTNGCHESLILSIDSISPFGIGTLIALFERAVGFYAMLNDINAYNQPAVEAGKRAARETLDIQRRILHELAEAGANGCSASELSARIGRLDKIEIVFRICERLTYSGDLSVASNCNEPDYGRKYSLASA